MQTEAFCLETEALEAAQTAHQHSQDTFYCHEEICLVQVVPAHRKNFFFRAVRGGHHTKCKYYKEPKDDDAEGDPKPKPTPNPQPLVPTSLGPLHRKRRERKPSRDELLALVKNAKTKPIIVPGTLEQIVFAWQGMQCSQRILAPLIIHGEQLNYQNAFVFINSCGNNLINVPWESRIIYGGVGLTAGRAPGYLFAESLKKFTCMERRLCVKLIIRPDYYNSTAEKTYVKDIPLPSRGTLFWHGPQPQLSSEGGRLWLLPPDDRRYHGFALRQTLNGKGQSNNVRCLKQNSQLG
jgi:hypothetical protein